MVQIARFMTIIRGSRRFTSVSLRQIHATPLYYEGFSLVLALRSFISNKAQTAKLHKFTCIPIGSYRTQTPLPLNSLRKASAQIRALHAEDSLVKFGGFESGFESDFGKFLHSP